MSNRDLHICIICKHKVMTELMRAADVFEPGKVMSDLTPVGMVIETKPEADPVKSIGYVITALQSHPKTPVILLWYPEMKLLWMEEGLKVISDGEHWAPIDEIIRKLKLTDYTELKAMPLD